MNARILIVEDEGLIALHIEEMLTHAGFEVPELFPSGEDAIAYLATAPPPDIILMDIGLAGPMNGIQAARHIREKADIPVIFLTAYTDRHHLCEAAEVSPYGYLTKPFTAKDLVAALEAALVRTGSPPGGGK
ncbi:MAG: response regulator [Methanoregula sp.]|nr:response regulator [Methanoregula sp.]